jgi:hypothetical protein
MDKGFLENNGDSETFPVHDEDSALRTSDKFTTRLNLTRISDNTARNTEILDKQAAEELQDPASPKTLLHATEDVNIKPSQVPMSPGGVNRRGFFDRSFSKLEKGGVRASTFALCSAAIGGGVLSLPYVFCIVGWGLAYIMLIISGISGVWSNLILAHLADKHKVRNYD